MKKKLPIVTLFMLLLACFSSIAMAQQPVTGVKIDQADMQLSLFGDTQLTATVFPANASNTNLIWESELMSSLEVGGDGSVFAVTDGSFYAFVTTQDGGFRDSILITCEVDSKAKLYLVKFPNQVSSYSNNNADTFKVVVPFGTDLTNVQPRLVFSPTATVSPLPSSISNYENTVSYTVTSEDGSKLQVWNIHVEVLPDLSTYTKYEFNFNSTTFSKNFYDSEETWYYDNFKLRIWSKDPTDAEWFSAGVFDDGLGLWPAQFTLDASHANYKIKAVILEFHENCGTDCSHFIFHGETDDSYVLPSYGEYSQYFEYATLADSVTINSSEATFKKMTLYLDGEGLQNLPPIAVAGNDTSVYKGAYLELDASNSYDPENEQLSYRWIVPEGIFAFGLTDTSLSLSLPILDVKPTYPIVLEVSDGVNLAYDTITISISTVNRAPVADAGWDAEGFEDEENILMGYYSYDLDNDSLTYSWSNPSGLVVMDDSTSVQPYIYPKNVDKDTTIAFILTVSDGYLEDSDTVLYTIKDTNGSPSASVSGMGSMAEFEVNELDTLFLDASVSSDPEEDELNYEWVIPGNLESTTNSAGSLTQIIWPEVENDEEVQLKLIVSDSEYSDTLIITVRILNVIKISATETANPNNVRVFPNPATKQQSIMVDAVMEISKIELFDLQGRAVSVSMERQQQQYVIHSLKSGVYVLRIESDSRTTIKKLIVK